MKAPDQSKIIFLNYLQIGLLQLANKGAPMCNSKYCVRLFGNNYVTKPRCNKQLI